MENLFSDEAKSMACWKDSRRRDSAACSGESAAILTSFSFIRVKATAWNKQLPSPDTFWRSTTSSHGKTLSRGGIGWGWGSGELELEVDGWGSSNGSGDRAEGGEEGLGDGGGEVVGEGVWSLPPTNVGGSESSSRSGLGEAVLLSG